jgi:hypothetical protein
MSIQGLNDARRILGSAVLGPEEVAAALGVDPLATPNAADRTAMERIPFDVAALEAGAAAGAMLVLRIPAVDGLPLTLLALGARLQGAIHPKAHQGVGYALRDEWTIDTQPFAQAETCAPGWYLVHRTPLPATCNRLYRLQDGVLAALPGPAGRPRRRSAVEAAYDTLLWQRAWGERLLADAWDWTRTPSSDQGFVAVGEFGPDGLGIIAYSRAVRFGSLGVCPQH